MSMVHFKLDTDADGIALVTWDAPGRSMNVIDLKVIEELSAIVDKVAYWTGVQRPVIKKLVESIATTRCSSPSA